MEEWRVRARSLSAVVFALGVAFYLFLMLAPVGLPRAEFDQDFYHLLVIQDFAREMVPGGPALDLSDYRSATAPGYHLYLAALAQLAGDGVQTLRAMAVPISALLVAFVSLACARLSVRGVSAEGELPSLLLPTVLALPVAVNLYVVSSAGWLLPDNAAWLMVAGLLALVLMKRAGMGVLVGGAVVLVLLVFTRQIHIWAAALVWAGAWLDAPLRGDETDGDARDERGVNDGLGFVTRRVPVRLGALALAVVATLPAFGVLGWMYRMWGGLVPPKFQEPYDDPIVGRMVQPNTGLSPEFPAVTLAVVAIVSALYLLPFVGRLVHALVLKPVSFVGWGVLGVVAGAATAAVPVTSYSVEAGRYSGVWNITRVLEVGDRSVILIVLAACGGFAVACWSRLLPSRDRIVLAVALAGPTAAQMATANAWARYVEPVVLIVLSFAFARAVSHTGVRPRLGLLAPLALAGLMAGVTVMKLEF